MTCKWCGKYFEQTIKTKVYCSTKCKNSWAVSKRRKELKRLAIEYKGGKCELCGYNKYAEVLEFHHIDPNEKEFGPAAKGHTVSWERLKEEVSKCMLLCANCHREIHVELKNNIPE